MKINGIIERGAKFFAGACLLALLNACGGGVSSSSDPAIPFGISPSTATAYSGVPTTLTLTGGGLRAPFLVVSSNATLLPVTNSSVTGTQQIVITPGPVTAQQNGTITVSDATGAQASAAITVLPNMINGDITVTGTAPAAFANCATVGIVCAGQSGSATLTLTLNGAPAGGRSVRFDVVQGTYQFPVDVAQTVFANSITVTSDAAGKVSTVLRANTGSSPQIATIRATDVATGAFRIATFLIKQPQVSGGDFVTVPSEWKVNGAYTNQCPAGSTDFLIFGGTPPYSIRSSAPGTSGVSPPVTPNENPSRFSVTYPALACGTDGYQVIYTVTDATGLTVQATLTVKPGTSDAPQVLTLSPQSIALACNQSAQVLASLSNAGTAAPTYTTSISTQTCTTTALVVPLPVNGVITLTRGSGQIGTTASCPAGGPPYLADTTPTIATVTVTAGSAPPQTITVNTQRTCP